MWEELATRIWDAALAAGPYMAILAIVVLYGAAKEWWVWGHVLRAERIEKEYWRNQALQHLGLAEKASQVASTAVLEETA